MSGHAHLAPSGAKLSHPIIDGDGHWVEYDPVFSEQMRRWAAIWRPMVSRR